MSDWVIQTTGSDPVDHQVDAMLRRINSLEGQVSALQAQLQELVAGTAIAAAATPAPRPVQAGLVGDVLQAGRSGGQQVAGGTASGEQLTLMGSSALADSGIIQANAVTHIWRAGSALGNLAEVARLTSGGLFAIGQGVVVPAGVIDITHPTNFATYLRAYSDSGIPTVGMIRARGAPNAPTAVAVNDYASIWRTYAYDGSANQFASDIRTIVSGTVSSGVVPCDMMFMVNAGAAGFQERLRLKSSGFFGIGHTAPACTLHMRTDNGGSLYTIYETFQATASNGPSYATRRARGTIAAPASVASGDYLGGLNFQGHDGTGWVDAARIMAYANGTINTSVMPTDLLFLTNAGGSSTTERMRIIANGRVGIGTSTPGYQLHIVDSLSATIETDCFGAPGRAQILFRAARGTSSVPAAYQSGDIPHQIQVQAHDGTTYRDSAVLRVTTTGAPTATGVPSMYEVFVSNGTALQQATRHLFSRQLLFFASAAPADADMLNSTFCFWLDPTVGASKLNIKAKNSAGTVVTGQVALA